MSQTSLEGLVMYVMVYFHGAESQRYETDSKILRRTQRQCYRNRAASGFIVMQRSLAGLLVVLGPFSQARRSDAKFLLSLT